MSQGNCFLAIEEGKPAYSSSQVAAKLIYSTGEDVFTFLFKPLGSKEEIVAFLETLYSSPKNIFASKHSYWLFENKNRVGFVLGYHGDCETELILQTIWCVLKKHKFNPIISTQLLKNFFVFQKMTLDVPKNMYYIAHFAILPEHHRKGLGSQMMTMLEEKLRERGFEYVCLDVATSNKPAIGLYEKFGFSITATLTNPDIEKKTGLLSRYRMEKKL